MGSAVNDLSFTSPFRPWGAPIWATHTNGNPNSYFRLQNDGNMVVYNANGVALWSSHTNGH